MKRRFLHEANVYGEKEKIYAIEALEWLKANPENDIDFSNNPMVCDSETIVESFYSDGAVKVEVVVGEKETSTRTLIVTLPDDKEKIVDLMCNIAEGEINTGISREMLEDGSLAVSFTSNWDLEYAQPGSKPKA
jgi:hypothetical protein